MAGFDLGDDLVIADEGVGEGEGGGVVADRLCAEEDGGSGFDVEEIDEGAVGGEGTVCEDTCDEGDGGSIDGGFGGGGEEDGGGVIDGAGGEGTAGGIRG